MDIGAVLARAWNISWKYKALWVLGVLAGCSASGRGNFSQSTSNVRGWNFQAPAVEGTPFEGLDRFFNRLDERTLVPIIIGLILLAIAVWLVFLVLGVLGQGGLIAAFGQADDGYNVSLGEAFSLGGQHFWRLLGIRAMVFVVGIVVAILAGIALVIFTVGTLGLGLVCLIPLLCLLIPLSIAIDAYIALTMVAAVEEKLGITDAFRRAWVVAQQQLGPVLVMTLILVIGGGIVGVILFLPVAVIAVPAIVGFIGGEEASIRSGLVVSGICLLAALPVLLVLSGVLTTFVTGVWTITYRRLTGKAGAAELGSAAAMA
jgi:hypothetical protein